MDLTTRIGTLTLRNPLIAASGCFGYGVEYAGVVDLSSLGGVCVKGLFLAEREGLATVFTIDNDDFETYRIGARKRFRILPGR